MKRSPDSPPAAGKSRRHDSMEPHRKAMDAYRNRSSSRPKQNWIKISGEGEKDRFIPSK